MTPGSTHIILNPTAGGGRTAQLLGVLEPLFRRHFGNTSTLSVTRRPGDAREWAREAALSGCRRLVVVGGDGTIHECVNGLLAAPARGPAPVTLGLISTGTGCGLARSLRLPDELEAQLGVMLEHPPRPIDLGKMVREQDGSICYFVNECQIGIGTEVVRRTRRGTKALGGSMAYVMATVPLLFGYPNPEVQVEIDAQPAWSLPVTGISIGNGAITGGGMHLTPHAELDDGYLDVLVMKGQSPLHRAHGFLRVRSGRHIDSPHFVYRQLRTLRVSSHSELPVAADGELVGVLPVRFEAIPRALSVHCPPHHTREHTHDNVGFSTEEIGV